MKSRIRHPAFLAVCALSIYLIGLIFGVYAVCVSPARTQQRSSAADARAVAREFAAGTEDTLASLVGSNTYTLIYDADGVCVLQIDPDGTRGGSPLRALRARYVRAALSGKEAFHVSVTWENPRRLFKIWFINGFPIVEHSSVTGAVFLAREQVHLPASLMGYILYFTLFYWLSAYFVVSNIRKNRKLEELRQNYVANVTHAFKTPIASIKALAETLCDGVEPDPDQQKVYYGMILQEANRQDHMVRDVLELSKLQSSGMDFSRTTLDARAVLDPILEKYAALGDCMGVALHPSQALAALPPLYSNASCLKQLFEILLDNALKFVPEGGEIWVEVSLRKNRAVFCVRDNGVGIAPEALPHVFERFFKSSHDFNESGSGLGLAIAREIAAGLKEKLWVESEPGKGAAFFFTARVK
jgi:signal transduction histidine kinase